MKSSVTSSLILDPSQSPTSTSAADRFLSPTPGSAKRRLFSGLGGAGSAITLSSSKGNSMPNSTQSPGAGTPAVSVHKLLAANGQPVFVFNIFTQ